MLSQGARLCLISAALEGLGYRLLSLARGFYGEGVVERVFVLGL